MAIANMELVGRVENALGNGIGRRNDDVVLRRSNCSMAMGKERQK